MTPIEFMKINVPEISARSLAELICVMQKLDTDTTAHLASYIQDLQDRVYTLEVARRDESYRRANRGPFYLRCWRALKAAGRA